MRLAKTFATAMLGSSATASWFFDPYPLMAYEMTLSGYTYSTHTITTDDNYEITAHRITGDANGTFTPDKPPVVIIPGMGMDASTWFAAQRLYIERTKAFIYLLADSGYDVFILNNRGTQYARGHATLNAASDSAYWDFSWAEMGLYDVKGAIETAISENGNFPKAYVIGYSQGSI